ncbi:transketolase C-terminal domain-containing protein [Nocardioides sp.]|uniref:alpha-ketoacid dehydrogenase subunit beta n=1 Tax=Nocardioides sp. TaxID=35761 RepID=UPI0026395BCF|nr:transketolase C-terminal domain-containing protein [Nocardioides sp.]MDI6911723.1 transketolase C-terminal domain-containing protein [Nocardioides sp.]
MSTTMEPTAPAADATVSINYRKVVGRAIADELATDPTVVFLGEDVGAAGGAFKMTEGLQARFGKRVRDTPIAEQAIVGMAVGAAIQGLRPVAEIMFADFAGVCFDQIVNSAAKYRFTSGGQTSVPLTICMANGSGAGFGPQHSQMGENWFLNIPGLKIVTPGTVEDHYGLLRSSIRDDNPVLFFTHKNLFALKGRVPAEPSDEALIVLGQASVVTVGSAVTVVANQQMRHRAVEAAQLLTEEGIDIEVIDPRTLVPFDMDTVITSLSKTSRLLVVQEGPPDGGWGATLVSRVASQHFELLDAPPTLLASDNISVPFAASMELASIPDAARIATAVRQLVAY